MNERTEGFTETRKIVVSKYKLESRRNNWRLLNDYLARSI